MASSTATFEYQQQRFAVAAKGWVEVRKRWAAEGTIGLRLANRIANLGLERANVRPANLGVLSAVQGGVDGLRGALDREASAVAAELTGVIDRLETLNSRMHANHANLAAAAVVDDGNGDDDDTRCAANSLIRVADVVSASEAVLAAYDRELEVRRAVAAAVKEVAHRDQMLLLLAVRPCATDPSCSLFFLHAIILRWLDC